MSFCKKINKKRLIPKPNVTFILCGKPHSTGVIHNAERKRQVLFPSIRGNFPSPPLHVAKVERYSNGSNNRVKLIIVLKGNSQSACQRLVVNNRVERIFSY